MTHTKNVFLFSFLLTTLLSPLLSPKAPTVPTLSYRFAQEPVKATDTTAQDAAESQGIALPASTEEEDSNNFFGYDEEEEAPAPAKGFWGRFADKMKKLNAGVKGAYSMLVKPKLRKWWYDKNGKEITIGVGSSLGTMVAMLLAMKTRARYQAYRAGKGKRAGTNTTLESVHKPTPSVAPMAPSESTDTARPTT